MKKELLLLALNNLGHRKKRSWLTLFSVILGVMAIVALMSIGAGMRISIVEEFEKIGTNKIFVMPASANGGPPGTFETSSITLEESDEIRKIKGVSEVAGSLYTAARIELGNSLRSSFVIGIPTDESLRLYT